MPSQTLVWTSLPSEIWTHIFCLLVDPLSFSLTCRKFLHLARDPYVIAKWLIHAYGRPLAFFRAFNVHPKTLTHGVAIQLNQAGAKLQRFFVQHIVKEYARMILKKGAEDSDGNSPVSRPISSALYAFMIGEAFRRYGEEADFASDDASTFISVMYGDGDQEQIRQLIVDYGFTPLKSLIPHSEEAIYRLSKIDMALIDHLINHNGWDPQPVNEGVMRRLVTDSELSPDLLGSYLDRGFKLTPQAIKAALRKCDQETLTALKKYVPEDELNKMVYEIFADNLAPDFNFSVGLVTFLKNHFEIPDDVVEKALLEDQCRGEMVPGSLDAEPIPAIALVAEGSSPTQSVPVPIRTSSLPPIPLMIPTPITRCFRQVKPGVAWRWVLRTYGPTHRFSQCCFDDTLLRLSQTDGGTRPTTHDFLAAGVQFHPRHVRYLSAIAMGSSGFAVLAAHDLLQRMRLQVVEGRTNVDEMEDEEDQSSWVASPPCPSDIDREFWREAFRYEVEHLRSLPAKKSPVSDDGNAPVWASRKSSDPAFPAAWFLREMESIVRELSDD